MKYSLRAYIIIALLAAVLFLPFLGNVHLFDWDEVNFAEASREMIVSNDYSTVQIDFKPFWEKPPLFFWFQVTSMKMFGINEFASRFPNAIAGLLTLLMLFYVGKKHFNIQFAWLWILVYVSSFLPFLYFKSGIIDPWFNLFIFSGIYFLIFTKKDDQRRYLNVVISAVLIGLATLTKGPVALLLTGLTYLIILIMNSFRNFLSLTQIVLYLLVFLAIGGLWFIILLFQGHVDIIQEFVAYQIRLLTTADAGHGGPIYYHFIVLIIGCFPMSIFAIKGFFKPQSVESADDKKRYLRQWMLVLFWVVLILFSLVKTKIVHYSSLAYFPLSFLAVYGILQMIEKNKIQGWIKALILFLTFFWAGAISALPFVAKYKDLIIGHNWIKDPFAVANLQANVSWSLGVIVIGVFLFLIILMSVLFIKDIKKTILLIFLTSLISIYFISAMVVPNIEPYLQGPAISFYRSLKGKDVYVISLFKSYAHLFYTNKSQALAQNQPDEKTLLNGEIDKPVYLVAKITQAEKVEKYYPKFNLLYRKNGYLFYERKP